MPRHHNLVPPITVPDVWQGHLWGMSDVFGLHQRASALPKPAHTPPAEFPSALHEYASSCTFALAIMSVLDA